MRAKDVLGRNGEQAAADYLETEGFRILARNWRCADGEIDIVAMDRHMLVICEVKTRSGARYGTPLESVTRLKRNRLRRLAVRWLTAHGVHVDQVPGGRGWRDTRTGRRVHGRARPGGGVDGPGPDVFGGPGGSARSCRRG